MNPRDKFIACLNRQPITGLVPHFELIFFLTMEEFGRVHPTHRNYYQWRQMSETERKLQREDMADIYIAIAERFGHSAIFIRPSTDIPEEVLYTADIIRNKTKDKYFIMLHGDATFAIPSGDKLVEFSYKLADEPENLKKEAEENVNKALETAQKIKKHGVIDGFALCSDYCFNSGPFISPSHFSEFVTPYLKKLIAGYKEMGFYAIKHTDGNIMPILDQLLETEPHALHSLDPQANVDIAEVKKTAGNKVCIIGNVNCGLMETGTQEEFEHSVRYALKHGMPGGGYIFSTSNCIYTGMRIERYRRMVEIWQTEGIYK